MKYVVHNAGADMFCPLGGSFQFDFCPLMSGANDGIPSPLPLVSRFPFFLWEDTFGSVASFSTVDASASFYGAVSLSGL